MKKRVNTFWWFMFLLFYLEIVYKIFSFNTLLSYTTIFLLPFTILYASILSIITGVFKKEKINKILTFIITFAVTFYYTAQYVYYKFYLAMISIYSFKMGTAQAFGWVDQILLVVLRNLIIVILLIIPFLLLIFFNKKIFTFKPFDKIKKYLYTSVIFASFILSLVSLTIDKNNTYSNYNLLFKVHYPTLTLNRFGLTTTALVDAYRYFSNFKEPFNYDDTNKNTKYDEKDYNVVDIDFDSLLKEESNDDIKSMHKYFMSKVPTNKNEYTGIFKDKNLIFINAESFDTIAVDEKLTPTLYKLKNEGFVFNNYYVPLFPVSTADGEYMNSTSLIPKEGVWSLYESSKVYMPYTLAHVFGKIGYNTYAYHNHEFDFYNRNLVYPSYGFNSFLACGNGLENIINCNDFPESDEELFTNTVNNYASKDKFLAYFMTVSGHLRYTKNNNIAKKNWKYVKDLDYSDEYKTYLAQNIDLDKGLEALINKLDEKGILDDTVIVLAPDHYPYGLNNKTILEKDNTRDGKFDLMHSTLIIWNPTIKTTEVNKITSSIDILPTVYNLFGIKYDSRLLMGNDVFSNSEGTIILEDRSFKTDTLTYDAVKDEALFTKEYDLEYLEQHKKDIYNKFTVSSKILEYDYYNKLANYLD